METKSKTISYKTDQEVCMAIPVGKLAELIHKGELCAADFRCLDSQSKKQVWQLCLWCCKQRVHCDRQCSQYETGISADK